MSIKQEIHAEYYGFLNGIKGEIDPVIKKMRETRGTPWRMSAWRKPAGQIIKNAKSFKAVATLQWSAIPVVGPLVVGIAAGMYTPWSLWIIIGAALLLAGLAYFGVVLWVMSKMATIGHESFHYEAFKVKRPHEYKIWCHIVDKDQFTFDGLYDFVNGLVHFGSSDPDDITRIIAVTEEQTAAMQETIKELQRTNADNDAFISDLAAEVHSLENTVTHLWELLDKVNENLYRLINNKLRFCDLDFISGFSVWRVNEDRLEFIDDKGTSGNSPEYYDLNEESDLAAVKAAKSHSFEPFMDNPYTGRAVLAFKIKMQYNEQWVWCFHFKEDDDRVFTLLRQDDNVIIGSEEIRRLIQAFCLILQIQMQDYREGEYQLAT